MSDKYLDVLLTEGGDGLTRTFVAPTSTATEGDMVLHDGSVYTIIGSSWVEKDSDMYIVLEGSTTLYVPEKIMRVKWEREEADAQ